MASHSLLLETVQPIFLTYNTRRVDLLIAAGAVLETDNLLSFVRRSWSNSGDSWLTRSELVQSIALHRVYLDQLDYLLELVDLPTLLDRYPP